MSSPYSTRSSKTEENAEHLHGILTNQSFGGSFDEQSGDWGDNFRQSNAFAGDGPATFESPTAILGTCKHARHSIDVGRPALCVRFPKDIGAPWPACRCLTTVLDWASAYKRGEMTPESTMHFGEDQVMLKDTDDADETLQMAHLYSTALLVERGYYDSEGSFQADVICFKPKYSATWDEQDHDGLSQKDRFEHWAGIQPLSRVPSPSAKRSLVLPSSESQSGVKREG